MAGNAYTNDVINLYEQVVPTLDDNSQLKARAAQVIQPITDHRTPNKRNREGWYNLASTELLAAIDDALSAGDITPAAVGGEAPTYDLKAADIQYAVFINSYMVHLAKDPRTGVMSGPSCAAVRKLFNQGLQAAADDRSELDEAVSKSWRFKFQWFITKALLFQANGNKLPASRKRQQPDEDEENAVDDIVVRKLVDENRQLADEKAQVLREKAQLADEKAQLAAEKVQLHDSLQEANNRLREAGKEQVLMPAEEDGNMVLSTPAK
ncbi:hypothetical protein OEZ85_014313 [Tetradesmus obliquus]|uniref:Uncharacterized protein n=1 Tax=Tetradesmus obliquus TaxID=3088 RepID=A0ABY8U7X5_TETOB|nr:hypothetical protein OEZ85_014313 [Tetradesmus obliquus]